jgi:hypothetical protein
VKISLTCIDTLNNQGTIRAVKTTLDTIPQISKVYWFSDIPFPEELRCEVEWTKVAKIRPENFIKDYNFLSLFLVPSIVKDDYNIIVQSDGFAVNPEAWTYEFLDYDYIGAVWPWIDPGVNVGNGGFSLRSKKLYEALLNTRAYENDGAEDTIIGTTTRPILESQYGIKYAPIELADRFSIEHNTNSPWFKKSLGFHGKHGIANHYDVNLGDL